MIKTELIKQADDAITAADMRAAISPPPVAMKNFMPRPVGFASGPAAPSSSELTESGLRAAGMPAAGRPVRPNFPLHKFLPLRPGGMFQGTLPAVGAGMVSPYSSPSKVPNEAARFAYSKPLLAADQERRKTLRALDNPLYKLLGALGL